MIRVLKCKFSNLKVTHCLFDYEGSITIPKRLMVIAGLNEYEEVFVHGKNRIRTYVMGGCDGEVQMNGWASDKFSPDDEIHLLCFREIGEGEKYIVRIIETENNKFKELREIEKD